MRILSFLAISLIVAIAGSTHCLAANTEQPQNDVVWATEAFPPFYNPETNPTGAGTVDQLLDLLEQELTNYQHRREFVPILRIISDLKKLHQIACASFLYDPNITDFAQYSIPLFTVPPQELILPRELWKSMGSPKSLSLVDLLEKDEFLIGLGAGRNYGKKLTPIIDQHRSDNKKLYFRVGDHFSGIAQMILHGRVDATIAYSGEAKYFMLSSEHQNSLVSVPILENNQALYVYVVLPKSDWGNDFLIQLNSAIKRIKEKPDYKKAIADWFSPDQSNANQ